MKLEEIARRLGCQLEGDGSLEISGLAGLSQAHDGDLSFLANTKYYAEARVTKASAVIVGPDCPELGVAFLRHKNPYLTFAKAIEIFYQAPVKTPRIHPTAVIAESAVLGPDVSVGAFSYVGAGARLESSVSVGPHCTVEERVVLGEGTVLHAGSVVYEAVQIGKRCTIHSNSVVGSDGFGYAKQDDGSWYKIYQAGTVVIADDVEIGACTTIDRATIGETRIGPGTKLDNLVQVGHGSTIGRDSLICAQVGLAGTTNVGNRVILAGQVGAAGHLTIGDGAIATPQTGIPGSVEAGQTISGSPAMDHQKWLKSSALVERLPEIRKSLRALEIKVASLEKLLNVSV